jgi:hypothetical protein
MTSKKLIAMAAGVLLVASSAFAQTKAPATKAPAKSSSTTPKAAKPTTHTSTGTIKSADASKLVLTVKKSGKSEDMTFMLGSSTTKTGDMNAGNSATVHYRVENGQNMATSVAAKAPKAAAAKPAATKAPATKAPAKAK